MIVHTRFPSQQNTSPPPLQKQPIPFSFYLAFPSCRTFHSGYSLSVSINVWLLVHHHTQLHHSPPHIYTIKENLGGINVAAVSSIIPHLHWTSPLAAYIPRTCIHGILSLSPFSKSLLSPFSSVPSSMPLQHTSFPLSPNPSHRHPAPPCGGQGPSPPSSASPQGM